MMTVLKGFFFDLDGTLVDTHGANVAAYTDAIHQVTQKQPNGDLRLYIESGESSNEFLPKSVNNINHENVSAINERKKEVYSNHLNLSVINEFMSTFLKQVYEHSTTILVTTAKKENALAVLRYHGLEGYFTHMIFGGDVHNMKPAPDAYELALSLSGLDRDEVLAFEDSQKGLEAANAAGIKVVHIRTFNS